MKRIAGFLVALLLLIMPSCADEMLQLEVPEMISGYTDNLLKVHCCQEGLLTLDLQQQGITVYRLADNITAEKGENPVRWDGLAAWDRPLQSGDYTLRAMLNSGEMCYEATASVKIGKSEQALLFAFASEETLYPGDETLKVSYGLTNNGTVVIEVYAENAPDMPLKIAKNSTAVRKQGTWEWNGKIDSAYAPAGRYTIRVYVPENPENCFELPVKVAPERDETLLITGRIMPENKDDICNAVAAPAVVADISTASILNIYRCPDNKSEVLGTICGQMQCLEVIEAAALWTKITCWRQEDGTPVTGYVRTDKLKAADVNTQYAIVVDKAAQEMTVYHGGKLLGEIPVSTGLSEHKKPEQETPAGSYLTGERYLVLRNDREVFDYAIRFAGNRTLYLSNDCNGSKSTTGGIAVPAATDEAQMDAYWLWTHIPPSTRLIILDDPEQRTLEQACAEAGIKVEKNAWPWPDKIPEKNETDTEIILTLGGDAVLGTREKWMRSNDALPAYLADKGMAYPFSGLQEYFSNDDMTLINLECVLKNDAGGEDKEKLYRFRGLSSYTDILSAGSVEKVNIANNHHIDYGPSGKASTVEALQDAGIPYSGYGTTYVWHINGYRIGFGGCRETTWLQGKQDIAAEIAALRQLGCDVIIYSCHWGKEYSAVHNETQRAMAQAVADAGADIIVGHHPHVVQGIDVIDDVPVLYSLGNLMFGGTHDLETRDGALARMTLRFDKDGYDGVAVTMIPILTSGAETGNDFHPVPATGEDRLRILAKIQADSTVRILEQMYFPAE